MKHMCENHIFERMIAGVLMCSICGIVIYETIEGIESNPHMPHESHDMNTIKIEHYVSGTASAASGVAGPIYFYNPLDDS